MRHLSLRAVLVALLTALPLVVGALPAEAASFTVTTTSTAISKTLGSAVTITGDVSPGGSGQPLALQKWVNGAFQHVASFKTGTSTGGYKVAYRPTATGTSSWRVCRSASTTYAKGCTPTIRVTILRWIEMTSAPPATQGSNIEVVDSLMIGDTSYPHSFRTKGASDPYDQDRISWNLHGKCTKVRFTANVKDVGGDGGNDSLAALVLWRDSDVTGTDVYTHEFPNGEVASPILSTSGFQRVYFAWYVHGDSADVAQVGTPMAYCAL